MVLQSYLKSSQRTVGTAQLLMTSLAIGQISLDVRTRNECFSVHYLCKLETKHIQNSLPSQLDLISYLSSYQP